LDIRVCYLVKIVAIADFIQNIAALDLDKLRIFREGNKVIAERPRVPLCKIDAERKRHSGRQRLTAVHRAGTVDNDQCVFIIGEVLLRPPRSVDGGTFLLREALIQSSTDVLLDRHVREQHVVLEQQSGLALLGSEIDARRGIEEDLAPVESAVNVLRKALAQSDGDVTLCAIGPLNNIADLLESPADEISHLCGTELVKEKCSRLVLMAGGFIPDENGKNRPEWNVKICCESSQKVFKLCKNDIYMLPHEAAHTMITGKYAVETLGDKTPLTYAFLSFFNSVGRSSWDPATLLWAVEGNRDLYTLSEAGRVTVDGIGTTDFYPDENGNCYVIGINQLENESFEDAQKRVAAYIDGAVNKILGI